MTTDPEDFERLAAECERVAGKTTDGELKAVLLEMAIGWRELADLQRRMKHDPLGR